MPKKNEPQKPSLLTLGAVGVVRETLRKTAAAMDDAEKFIRDYSPEGLWIRTSEKRIRDMDVVADSLAKAISASKKATLAGQPFTEETISPRSKFIEEPQQRPVKKATGATKKRPRK